MAGQEKKAEAGWEVKNWREVERLETGERTFEVELLGTDLPTNGLELVPAPSRSEPEPEKPSDFCKCGHTRGSHGIPSESGLAACAIEGCFCSKFRLLAMGVEGIEEPPPDPHPLLTIVDAEHEDRAITFIRQLVEQAGLDEPDPELWMALQRLLDSGWRLIQPPEES